jgi:hypothetical protein
MVKNLEKYKAAKDEKEKAKWKKVAAELTKRKHAANDKLEKLVQQLDKDVELVIEAKLPKRFTVKTKQTIDGTIYSPGDYALKKKRAGGGIYLNMDKGEMLGVDARNIPTLEEGELTEDFSQRARNFRVNLRMRMKDLKKGGKIKVQKLTFTKVNDESWEWKGSHQLWQSEAVVKQIKRAVVKDIQKWKHGASGAPMVKAFLTIKEGKRESN